MIFTLSFFSVSRAILSEYKPAQFTTSFVSYVPFVLGGQDHLLFDEVLKVFTGDRSPRSTTMIISSTFNDQDYREYSVTKFD